MRPRRTCAKLDTIDHFLTVVTTVAAWRDPATGGHRDMTAGAVSQGEGSRRKRANFTGAGAIHGAD